MKNTAVQDSNYKNQALRIAELTKELNKRAKLFASAQQGKGTYFTDLAKVASDLEEAVRFLGGKI